MVLVQKLGQLTMVLFAVELLFVVLLTVAMQRVQNGLSGLGNG